jgi:hypothetical protein
MIDRIFHNPKTTLLGLILMVLCFIALFMEKATLTEISVFLMGGFALLFSTDKAKSDGKVKGQ